jgi:hypothetical protein
MMEVRTMNVRQITLLAGFAFSLVACARQQTEEDTGDIEPAVADTGVAADTAMTPTEIPQTDTGVTPATPPVTGDTAVTTDTSYTGGEVSDTAGAVSDTTGQMSDTAMTQMGDTTTAAAGGDVATGGAVWRATLLPQAGAEGSVLEEAGVEEADTGAVQPSQEPGGMNVGGAAFMMPADDGKGTTARVQIKGAKPGTTHPWHVHKGTCGKDQGILGPADAYTPITVGQDGQAEVSVTLPIPTPTSGEYMVNIHESAQNMKTIIACGPLTLSGGQ